MSLNGTVVDLSAGDYRATIAAAGATLCSLTWQGRDLVAPFDPAAGLGLAYQGRTLAPWPNRVTDGRYSFGGADYELPRTEHATGASLHGMACWTTWQVRRRSCDAVEFALDLPGMPGYPFDVRLTASYTLSEDGLAAEVTACNEGASAAPVGLSTHPYLTVGSPLEDCTFTLPGERVLTVDAAMRPVAVVGVEEAGLDFRRPTPMAGRRVDHAFTGLPATWVARLQGPDGFAVEISSDAPWAQAFSADLPGLDRGCLAVEPMTCGPDAFNREDVSLDPGERLVLRYGIAAAAS